jgi:DNA end-binding protein Ku
MSARAIWKGNLRFKNIQVPVKLYSVVQERGIHFRMLHDQDMVPVQQKMVNALTGKEVETRRALKGAEVEPGVHVVITAEELKEIEPEPSRDIVVDRFVKDEQITDQWYDRPYYLGPDGDERGYWALRDALKKEGKEGVARWTMRNREYIGALRVGNDRLMLITLRFAGEVVPVEAIGTPTGSAAGAKERKMAEQLVSALEGKFVATEYRDEYRERVLDFLARKARGEKIRFRRPRPKSSGKNLLSVLNASLKRVHASGRPGRREPAVQRSSRSKERAHGR